MTPRRQSVPRCTSSLFGILLLFAASLVFAQADGPYVLRNASGGWEAWVVQDTPDGARKKTLAIDVGATFTIPAVASVPAFEVKLRAPAKVAADIITTRSKSPIFVVADTHGEYELLAAMLQKHRIVDAHLRWSFGRGHLVVLGDVFDRGPNHTEILWLLYELETQAQRAGGGVHLVLGNHEAMVMGGDLRYLNPKYVNTAAVFDVASYSQLFAADSVLGQWLRTRPAVLKIDDLLCVHAGISHALLDSKLSLAGINAGVRLVLEATAPAGDSERERAVLLMGSAGPLWYRGYFAEQTDFPTASMDDIDRAMQWFGVRKILVGHTIVPTITQLYDGKVIAVQVYPRRENSGQTSFESLLIRRGELWRANLEGLERMTQ
jgi:hypothetical protein